MSGPKSGDRSTGMGGARNRHLLSMAALLAISLLVFRILLFGGSIGAPEVEEVTPPSADSSLQCLICATVPLERVTGFEAVSPGGKDPTVGELLSWRGSLSPEDASSSLIVVNDMDHVVGEMLELMSPGDETWVLELTSHGESLRLGEGTDTDTGSLEFLSETTITGFDGGRVRVQLLMVGEGI